MCYAKQIYGATRSGGKMVYSFTQKLRKIIFEFGGCCPSTPDHIAI